MNPDLSIIRESVSVYNQNAQAGAAAEPSHGNSRWQPNPGPQTDALLSEADELLYGGAAGGGKGQSLDALVLTPFGYKTMGSLKIGSVVNTPHGTCAQVIAIFELGERQLYQVTFHDGTSTEVTDDHIWLAWRIEKKSKATRLWTTSQLREQLSKSRSKGGFRIPCTDPVAFSSPSVKLAGPSKTLRCRPVNPYVLGALLGDGSLGKGIQRICSADRDILDRMRALCTDFTAGSSHSNVNQTVIYEMGVVKNSNLQKNLARLGLLGTYSETKFIPADYLLASVEDRWLLMQGLMDTDGFIQGGCCHYCTVSERLSNDVASLARSLGAVVTTRTGRNSYNSRGQKLQGQLTYKLRLKFADSTMAVHLQRKKDLCYAPQAKPSRKIISIEPTRVAPARCIVVSDPSGLYITNDYIVTHNSDLLLGIPGISHLRSIIFRRVFPELRGLIDRSREIYNFRGDSHAKDSYNEQLHTWRLHDGRVIEFGALQYEKDKESYRGRPHDFYGWDELTEFTESQYRFVNAWNRTTRPGQRCRIIATANPPHTDEGRWIIGYWGPWIDDKHPNPAKPGELRWFAVIDGEDVEVGGPQPITHKGEVVIPRSRTFIPALLADNPYLMRTNYGAVLQGLPEPLRSQMLLGDFKAGITDDQWQVIPTAWVDAAIERGKQNRLPPGPMTTLGVDPSRGGRDQFIIAPRFDNWFAPLIKYKGVQVPDGPTGARLVVEAHQGNAVINVDVIGLGSSVYDSLKDLPGLQVVPINNSQASKMRDKTDKYKLVNVRAASYWKFREALDPENEVGICLPDDNQMRADLVTPRFKVTAQGILVEPKEDIIKRLGRSPDCGDAVVMAHFMTELYQQELPAFAFFSAERESVWRVK